MQCRAAAARVIQQVLQGSSLADCLPRLSTEVVDPRDQSLLQALSYGVCRHYFTLAALLDHLLLHPLKDKDLDVYALLLVGLYQLRDMRIPAYAAVAATVDATTVLNKTWARGLVNAVLRNYQRQTDALAAVIDKNASARVAHPDWLMGMIQKAWPADSEAIYAANNAHPPMMLRVNQRHHTRDAYLAQLQAAGIAASAVPATTHGVVLDAPCDVQTLPGFTAGDVSVQDGAAQLAVDLLQLAPGQRVLDACAAPGGKTAHIAESQPALAALVAVDRDPRRLTTVSENLTRLHLQATCLAADAADTAAWWDGQPFDRILLDAPCSATGVIRRHPDIKLLRRPDDIANLVAEQLHLLTALWPLLKIGGRLLYATCSILPRENAGVLASFLATHPDAQAEDLPDTWGHASAVGRQILPGMQGMDGFYYARLTKTA